MARQTSFAHQKEILRKFSGALSQLEQELRQLSGRYEATIYSLYEEDGLMEEIYADYQALHMNKFMTSIEALAGRISSEDIPFIEKELRFISSRSHGNNEMVND